MGKSRERNETEHYRAIIRQLKSENRHLKKQLARAEKNTKKQESLYQELTTATDIENYATPEVKEDDRLPCPKCTSKLKELDLGLRTFYTCPKETCGYRRSVVKK